MDMNSIGKFQLREILNAFDATLIRLYGVNMRDAGISRFDVISAQEEFGSPEKAAEALGTRRGLARRAP